MKRSRVHHRDEWMLLSVLPSGDLIVLLQDWEDIIQYQEGLVSAL